ncbi:DUF3180 domain-containing protein [Actinoalloteichus hymeniacidonis]|uniref:DUF3180 family protein n=1 Tax=Actinoalloteichus hymeniacidonis TaxID=340345 RepID=A0AAC9HKT8_9PSEU|nr:DUF3180 domain-containing protein [Actinoalloteichus hymeniacidonis]AOS61177.1 putative DUF3180 family protein [Actinoalloteichus hymeniacidonis]MBB5910822.1 polyferredoxin [Actinoalloteichus hymeniacidonis]
MKFTRARDLGTAVIIAGLLFNLVVQAGYGTWPPLPLLAGSPLFVLAVVEVVLAFSLRSRIGRRPGAPPVEPLVAARAVALAKATSLTSAIVLGAWLGVVGYLIPLIGDISAAGADMAAAVVGAVSAAAAIAAGLWLEHCCRTPEDDDEKHPDRHA